MIILINVNVSYNTLVIKQHLLTDSMLSTFPTTTITSITQYSTAHYEPIKIHRSQKKGDTILLSISLLNIDRFS